MNKIKLLVVPSDTMGVGHFRSIWPAQSMAENFSDKVEVEINPTPDINDMDYLTQFDIIHFHRHLGSYNESEQTFSKLKSAGVTLVMDIDDFWEPPTTHPLYEVVKRDGVSEKILKNVKLADYVTTTTSVFADYIKPHNPNIYIIPNALDMNHRMWKSEAVENRSGKCRISWIGGSSHEHDLELMRDGFMKLYSNKELEDKFQVVMCGFDTRGSITEVRPDGSRSTRKIKPHETVWRKFEDIFTASNNDKSKDLYYWKMGRPNEREKDEDYYKWLDKIKKEKYKDEDLKTYVRRWTLPLTQYGKHYDYCDVCLAPLMDHYNEVIHHNKNGKTSKQVVKRRHVFNEVKSELKIIEAGMKKKALIAQDFGIYKELIEDGKTGILVSDNKKGWYKAMREVILNPDYREELANNLHEYVKDRYELKNVTKDRVSIYEEIMKKKKELVG
jgi:glycosyltransferase involved in cell wall biosynthesis